MQIKLALRNIRRSIKDYSIYFITLVFGVAMFYAFNSVRSQSVLFDLEGTASASVFALTGDFLTMFSVVIAFVLGFLVIYANRFLIKRRKREFGTYLMLGMKPGHVTQIVLIETLAVGFVSLVVGLVAGIALSQVFSFVTAGLFNISMTKYQFIFAPDACLLTLACFLVIFAVVAVFNTVSVSRYKLIDLLSAHAKNERFRMRNPWVSLGVFVASVGIIAASYKVLIDSKLLEFGDQFFLATGLMLVGTLLFFWSLSGFVVMLVQRTRGLYFRGLTMFTLRQIASKVNTAFMSLWLVCIMLFFSLTVFSAGMGMVKVFTGNLDEGTLYDATLTANVYLAKSSLDQAGTSEDSAQASPPAQVDSAALEEGQAWNWDSIKRLSDTMPEWEDFVETAVQIDIYQPAGQAATYGQLKGFGGVAESSLLIRGVEDDPVALVSQSQFNAARIACGRDPVEVGVGEYAINNTFNVALELSEVMARAGAEIQVAGRTLVATGELVSQPLSTNSLPSDAATLVVSDEIIDAVRASGHVPDVSSLNINYKVERSAGDKALYEGLSIAVPPSEKAQANGSSFDIAPWPVTMVFTANEVMAQAGGLQMMITYLALYIGFIFLITTAAVLAIQQLSETNDSLSRYRVLAELGCDRRMIFGSLRTQVLIYFLVPLGLALCHCACAVGVLGATMFAQLGVSVAEPSLLAALFVVVVYGSYLLVTYFASRSIVKSSLGKKLVG